MAIEDIFKSTVTCSCGLCCSKETLCENCSIATLKANGLPESLLPKIRGLKHKNHSGGYTEMYWKLNELRQSLK